MATESSSPALSNQRESAHCIETVTEIYAAFLRKNRRSDRLGFSVSSPAQNVQLWMDRYSCKIKFMQLTTLILCQHEHNFSSICSRKRLVAENRKPVHKCPGDRNLKTWVRATDNAIRPTVNLLNETVNSAQRDGKWDSDSFISLSQNVFSCCIFIHFISPKFGSNSIITKKNKIGLQSKYTYNDIKAEHKYRPIWQ